MSEIIALVSKLAARDAARSEAEVQSDLRTLLLTASLGLTEDVRLETQAGERRRIDVEAGSTVIEVKKDLRVGNVLGEAVEQLRGYVESREQKFDRRYVGILTDGAEWHCYHLRDAKLEEIASPLLVSENKPDVDGLLVWLEGVLATAKDIRPVPEEIRQRLGAGSSAHALDRASLAALYEANRDAPEVRTKRRLWARLLATALGTQFEDSDDLFIEHTLLVNTAEIIAHAVIGLHPENLVPRSLLSGAKFDEAQVHGVVESDFFDWVAEVPKGDQFVRTLARRIVRFDWPAVTHDVLKVLYESVIEAATRKKLGEYYTPDWLASKIVETAVPDPLRLRVLDPACGSGTFLFHAVRRYLDAADRAGTPPAESLASVTRQVVGMDLHPVAVTLARVTYLLAMGQERLASERGAVRIPVFLGDSVQWRKRQRDAYSTQEFVVPVDDLVPMGNQMALMASEFRFGADLLRDATLFDNLVSQLADEASKRRTGSKTAGPTGIFQRLAVPEDVQPSVVAVLELMRRLHDEGRNHIWGYYIRNLARPEWLARDENRADVLVGNPPWLAYRFMSAEMQAGFREMSEARGLWHGAKVATHQDLSALFVTRAVQLYLKRDGRFAFVMPSAVLDRQQYRGFRTGALGISDEEVQVAFGVPWDLRRLRPHFFPITASVVFGARSTRAAAMPTRAEVWSGRLDKNGPDWRNASWPTVEPDIKRRTSRTDQEPDTIRSPYHARFRQGASIVPRVLFMVERLSAGPLGQSRNRTAVRSARSANEKKPWKDLPRPEGVIETEFVYRVHLGETVLPYRILQPAEAVLPVERTGLLDDPKVQAYPGLSAWWSEAQAVWEANRSSERLTLTQQLDFQRKLSAQLPLSHERIVYSKSGMHLAAARLRDARAVVDHTLYWAAASTSDEALYLCAILNAAVVTQRVRPLMSFGKDERHVDKYVWGLPIPMYDEAVAAHRRLADLGRRAEQMVAVIDLPHVHFATQRRAVRKVLADSDLGKEIEQAVGELLAASSAPS